METHRFQVFADYFQVIVMDEASDDDFASLWDRENSEIQMLAIGKSTIGIGTLRNADVYVDIHIDTHEPSYSVNEFDHLVEASIHLPSGDLAIMGGAETLSAARRIKIAPGSYRLLYAVRGIETIQSEYEPADDIYSLFLWPATQRETTLVKHWKSSGV